MSKSNLKGREVYLVDGSRTPFLKAQGKPGPFRASDLAIAAGRPLLMRQPFEPDALDEVILGCVSSGPDEANIARIAALRLGCGYKVPAWTVHRNCASGMQSVDSAALNIATGRSNLVLAGGTEAMSHHPVLLNDTMITWLGDWSRAKTISQRASQLAKLRPGHFKIIIALLRGLSDPIIGLSMGQTAEIIAHRFGISREMMDQFAVNSHQRLGRAIKEGWLDEVEAIFDSEGKLYELDDGLRVDSSVEKLAKLRPVFDRPTGKVTAGNSAQVTDGAAWLLLASAPMVKKYKLQPLGRLIDSQWSALDPSQMGLGPVHAMSDLLQRNEMVTEDIDYWEINEAFAAQVLACQAAWQDEGYCLDELGLEKAYSPIPSEILNVDGGGVSLGHPVGASGTRILLHLLKTLQRNNKKYGIASLCIGGGQGGAMLLENLS
jgi:acetyl-CoA C-acetyltransferase